MQIEIETGQVLSQVGAVHDERAFRQQEEVIAPLRGPQGSRHAEPERPRSGRQHSTARVGQDRVAARCRILRRPGPPPDARHAADRRGPAALPRRAAARNRWRASPSSLPERPVREFPRLRAFNSDSVADVPTRVKIARPSRQLLRA